MTSADYTAAYRKTALEHHPDKAGAAVADEDTRAAIEERFKAIQEAYETLSDPARRREFDSTDDFDDTLPVDCAPKDFFKACAWCPSWCSWGCINLNFISPGGWIDLKHSLPAQTPGASLRCPVAQVKWLPAWHVLWFCCCLQHNTDSR